MENMTISGQIYRIDLPQQISDKLTKREFIIVTADKYPQHIICQVTNERCSLLDNLRVGDNVKISINLRGRLWNDPNKGVERCFNTIDAWAIELASHQTGSFAPPSTPPMQNPSHDERMNGQMAKKDAATPPNTTASLLNDDDDDLPF